MKLLFCALATLVFARRTKVHDQIGPVNDVATGQFALTEHEQFMNTETATMTSFKGPVKLEIEERRKLWKFRQFNIYDVGGGDKEQILHWKTHWNPIANERRSIRDMEGKTINRVHHNQIRRLRARARSFLTMPGNRKQTYYTFNWAGWFGKRKETKQTGIHKNVHTNLFTVGKGLCRGSFNNKGCKGQVMTAKSFNMGYKIEFYMGKGDKVATAELRDMLPGGEIRYLVDRHIRAEKRFMTLEITSDSVDNLMIAEFAAWIMQYEWWGARMFLYPRPGLLQ